MARKRQLGQLLPPLLQPGAAATAAVAARR